MSEEECDGRDIVAGLPAAAMRGDKKPVRIGKTA